MVKKTLSEKPISAQASGVLQATEAELPYPIIQRATNNSVLYPIDAIDGTTATLTLPANATHVTFYLAIKDQDGPVFEPVSVANGVNVVDIPAKWISYCIGHTVLIKYTANAGGRTLESLTLELEVQQIREEHLVVSRPVFEHSKEEEPNTWRLRMQSFTGDETVHIKAWPMINAGQRLFVTVAGNQHVTPYRFRWVALDHVVQPHEAHAAHVFRFSLSRGWLSRLDDYSSITAHLGVIWDKTAPVFPEPGDPLLENPLPVNAQDFHLRTTSLLHVDPAQDLDPPHLRESVELPPDQWQVNPTNTVNGGHAIVSYEGLYEGDHVCAYASGPNYGPVALGCQDVKSGETNLLFDVAPDIIAALFNNTLTLNYSLRFNSYEPQYSPDRVVKVLAPQLTRPGIEQATGNTVDLNTFSDDATGVVPIWDFAKERDCCWMKIIGTLEDGSAYEFDVWEGGKPLTAAWLSDGVDTPISRAKLQKLADCKAFELHFAANFDGQCAWETAIKFPVRTFSIEQEALILPAPRVCEAVDDQLTIWNGRDGVTVRVEYERISPHQTIQVRWIKADGTSLPMESKPGNSDPGYVDFAIPREAVIQGAGKTILINYIVTSSCKLAPSKTLALKISVPTRLPPPVVPEATPPATKGGILDLRSFTGDAHITVEKWWFILVGQVGWLECRGTQENGSPYIIRVMLNEPITTSDMDDGLSRVIKREELEKLRDRTALDVVFKCAAEIGGYEAGAIEFPLLHLEFHKSFYDYTDFNPAGKDWNNWERGLGATDSRDLRLKQGQVPPHYVNGYYREDWGYTNTTDPATQREKMFKNFIGLEVGKWYEFSAWVRDSYALGTGRKPALVLVVQGVDITLVTRPGTAWELLKGTFKASSRSLRLSLDNMEMGIGPINDYDVTGITVKEV
ncbi:hypothetical protein C4K03_4406 [Pseudomonas synxantha]|uniref:Uncharacterized protein n=1 Tax=Pseudomonas synxantha TaxID=47883 RepID=A0A3G7UAY1_9PSED|nr:hypothetical protein [Pseudomonas synxantha]AZE56544.1 hypothetical protein C4K03_4406 [Pseudomonas synxantha]